MSFHPPKPFLTVHISFIFSLYSIMQLGEHLYTAYTAEQLRQYMCFYDESQVDISLANAIAELAYRIIDDAGEHPMQDVRHWAESLMPLATDELKESANADTLIYHYL